MSKKEIVIVDGARTPVGNFGGALRDMTAMDLGVIATKAAMEKAGVLPEQVDEFIYGHARQAGCGPNTARQVSVRSGIPATKPAFAVQQACASGMQAIVLAAQKIMLDEADIIVAGGMEHMSSIPYLSMGTRWGVRMGHEQLADALYKDGYICGLTFKHMGEWNDLHAKELGITREEQDEYALGSQRAATRGKESGFFAKFMAPVEVKQKGKTIVVDSDEHVRPDTTLEGLAKLPPVFNKEGTITAGNASAITDGATTVVVTSKQKADELGLTPLGYLRSNGWAALESRYFGIAPVDAINRALNKAGRSVKDTEIIEINEAFASQVISVMRPLGLQRDKVNIYGGGISIGHPTGNSGARIILTLLYALREHGKQWGLAGICANGGIGGAVVVESAG